MNYVAPPALDAPGHKDARYSVGDKVRHRHYDWTIVDIYRTPYDNGTNYRLKRPVHDSIVVTFWDD